jgi:hypothetical protein
LRSPTPPSHIPPPSKPLPQSTSITLLLLLLSASAFFLSTFPSFQPENIFRLTHSRLSTSSGVIQTRLSALRPLKPTDHLLRRIFDSTSTLDPRLLYAQFGPNDLIDAFPLLVTPSSPSIAEATLSRDAANTLLYYSLPGHLLPHILHLAILGLATSPTLSGRAAARFRLPSLLAALALCAAELYLLTTHDPTPNRHATRISETRFLHWNLLLLRGLGLATLDALLGWAIYASTTNRGGPTFLVRLTQITETPEARLALHGERLDSVLSRLRGLGVLRNALVRDREARGKAERYWMHEGEVVKDVFESREVVEAVNGALRRTDVDRVGRDAEGFVEGVLRAR